MTITKRKIAIPNINAKIGTLERRRTHLQMKVARDENHYSTSTSAEFDRAEIDAITGAIAALEFCRDN